MSGTYMKPDMGSYMNSDGKSDLLNQESAHDTGLYDPSVHDNQIVAMYETNERAHTARDDLLAAGVPSDSIQVIDQTTTDAERPDQGFWGSVRSLFMPDDEVNAYGHAVHHGHAMLVVHPKGDIDRSMVIHALERTEPVDFDAKLEEWRQAGYDYSSHPMTGSAVGAAAGMAQSVTLPTFDSEVGTTASPPPSPFVETRDTMQAVTPDERMRVGQREAAGTSSRVRSYVAQRPAESDIAARAASEEPVVTPEQHGAPMQTGGSVTNATLGATTSGMNAPRP